MQQIRDSRPLSALGSRIGAAWVEMKQQAASVRASSHTRRLKDDVSPELGTYCRQEEAKVQIPQTSKKLILRSDDEEDNTISIESERWKGGKVVLQEGEEGWR
jgi:hypothetical protein